VEQSQGYFWVAGDCLDLLSELPDKSIQLILTSPPYNIGKEYEEKLLLEDYLYFHEKVIAESVRVLKEKGSICLQVGNFVDQGEIIPLDIIFYPLFAKHGLKLRNRIVWHFEHGMHNRRRFSGRYETILWFTLSDEYDFYLDPVRVPQKHPNKRFYKGPRKGEISSNPLGKNPGDVWKITNVKNGHPEKIDDGHPCQFPISLAERIVLSMSAEGDAVLDPFGGTATTLVTALKNNRVGISAEINEKYYQLGLKRIKQFEEGKLPHKAELSKIASCVGKNEKMR